MRRLTGPKTHDNLYQSTCAWVLTLTFALLPLIFWPTARDANLAKPLLLIAGLIVINALLLVRAIKGGRTVVDWGAIDVCVGLYALAVCASLIYSDYRAATLVAVRVSVIYSLLYFTARFVLTDEHTREKIVMALLWSCTAVSLVGIYERFGSLPWGNPTAVSSTWFNRTYLAAYLLTMIPIAIWAAMEKKAVFRTAGFSALSCAIPALIFTSATIAWMGAVPILAISLIMAWPLLSHESKRKLVKLVLLSASLIGIFELGALRWSPHLSPARVVAKALSSELDASNSERLGLMVAAVRMGCCSPVIGKGAGAFGIYAPENAPHACYANMSENPTVNSSVIIAHAHNEFLEVFAELGVIGLAVFVSIPIAAMWRIRTLVREKEISPGDKKLAVALLTGIVGFLVANMVGRSARVPGEMAYFYILPAILGSIKTHKETWVPLKSTRRKIWIAATSGICALLLIIGWSSLVELKASIYVSRGESLLTDPYNTFGASAAVEEFKTACRLTPKDPGVWYELGNALAVSGRHYEAIDAYDLVNELSPDYGRVHFNKATSLFNMGRYYDAEHEMTLAHEQDGLPDSRARLDYLRSMFRENSK